MSDLLFAFVPGFYAEAERVRDVSLRDRPVIVGGDPRKRGLVQSATPDALSAGVLVGMEVLVALGHCPVARAVPTDMKHYREVSGRLRALLQDGEGAVEPLGLDSAFIEPSAGVRAAGGVEPWATQLRERVREELGLPLKVGIAQLKFLARIAAEDAGTDGILRIGSGEESTYLHPLSVSRLPGVGPRTIATLAEHGVVHVADLLTLEVSQLEEVLGNHGLRILGFAKGRDESVLHARRSRKSLSREFTFSDPEVDRGAIDERLQRLAQEAIAALQQEGLVGRRISVRAGYEGGEWNTRTRTLGRAPMSVSEIYAVAVALLELTQVGTRPVRRLGLSIAELSPQSERDRQLELF